MARNTPLKVSSLTKEGFHRDHGDGAARGLYVQVTKGAKGPLRSWIYRYVSPVTGKSRWMGLGPCDVIDLSEARDLARAARRLVKLGADPIEHRRATVAAERGAALKEAASQMTFEQCAESYLAEHLASFRNVKHRNQWRTSLERANDAFGRINVAEIDTPTLVKFLEPIWRETAETGSRIRGRIEKVLDWAKARGFRDGENPARWRGHLEHLLRARPKAEHHSAMPFDQLPDFMGKLRERESISAKALEFCILTATRSGEVRGATWDEIDPKTATWTIPASRMKADREHTVPLSDRAVAILEAMPRCGAYLFPGAREGRPQSDMAMTELLRGMDGNGYRVHGFRSSFRDWAGDMTAVDRETIEHALAHQLPDKTERSYRRASALNKRRLLMESWAAYCEATPIKSGEVVPMRA
jgi:integrase